VGKIALFGVTGYESLQVSSGMSLLEKILDIF
jgi:hypothetical protein